jgi:TPR repeat protein
MQWHRHAYHCPYHRPKEAVKWWKKGAEQGDAGSQCNLGSMYDDGCGVKRSAKTAASWYEKGAKQGHS